MKVINVLELLCENKENFVRKRDKILQKYKNNNREETNLPDDTIINGIINNLSSIDPSQKYMEWLTKQYLNDEYILGEDDEQVKQDLKLFTELKNKVEHKDINKYSLSSLRNELNKHLTVLTDDEQFKAQITLF